MISAVERMALAIGTIVAAVVGIGGFILYRAIIGEMEREQNQEKRLRG